jgi:hypothetical protein
MTLYEKDVRTANHLLEAKDKSLKTMHNELTDLRRRVSLGSTSTRSSLEGQDNDEGSLSPPQQQHALDDRGKPDDLNEATEASICELGNIVGPQESDQSGKVIADKVASAAEEVPGDRELPSLSASEARLRTALVTFYKASKIKTSDAQATRLARMCGGSAASADATAELWAAIANKYGTPPVTAVACLARTMGPLTPVQWAKEQVPKEADAVLDRITLEAASSSSAAHDSHCQEIRLALKDKDFDMLSALTFRGCPEALRPEVWRALLQWRGRLTLPLQERRQNYQRLKAKAEKIKKRVTETSGDDVNAMLAAAPNEIAADMRHAWNNEPFLAQPGVAEAVAAIAWATAARYGWYIRGSCEMAALLLFVMSSGRNPDGSEATLADAEADAFWSLAQLMIEMDNSIVDNVKQTKQAQHIHYLLRLYDAPLADLLSDAGIVALPTTRLGVALCCRSGFTLAGCVRLWDALLADPKRFEFCNYTIVAALLMNRKQLMKQQHDPAALAEEVLAAPRRADMTLTLATAYAICAFERRVCDGCSQEPFPPRPGVLDTVTASALEAAHTHLSSAWGKVRAGGAGVWRAGREAIARRVAATAAAAPAIGASDDRGHGGPAKAMTSSTAALEAGII